MVFVYKDFTAGSRLMHISKCTVSKLNAYKKKMVNHTKLTSKELLCTLLFVGGQKMAVAKLC